MDDSVSMQDWNLNYDARREFNKRKHSPVCTEALLKGYRCMKKSHGVRSQCQDLIDAVYECRNPNLATLQRKPTKAAAAAATASATASTPTPAV